MLVFCGEVCSNRHHTHRLNLVPLDEFFDLFASVIAIHYWHVAVQQDQAVRTSTISFEQDFLEGLLSVQCRVTEESKGFYDHLQTFNVEVGVIHNEYLWAAGLLFNGRLENIRSIRRLLLRMNGASLSVLKSLLFFWDVYKNEVFRAGFIAIIIIIFFV